MRPLSTEANCGAQLQLCILADVEAAHAELELGTTKGDPRFLPWPNRATAEPSRRKQGSGLPAGRRSPEQGGH